MKIVAILLLLAVAAHARPPKGGDEKPEDAGASLFMSLVKLCMRLEDAGSDDKRSWDAVFGLFGNVCEGIKNALGDDVNQLVPAERSMDAPSRDGDKRPPPKPSRDGDNGPPKKSAEKGSGPSPTADYPSRDGDRRPPKKGSNKERSMDKKPESPEGRLLKICFALAELGEQMDNGQDKRGVAELEAALAGMEQVCLAAFVEAHAEANE